MEINFKGKKALVTGAGKGIGRGVAVKLSECRADVLAVSRTKTDLDELSKEHPKIKTLCLDISDWESTKSAIEQVGPIDLLVNNAAVDVIKMFGDMTQEDIDRVYNVNVKAVINISQIVAKGMIARGQGGAIVNVSSTCSLMGFSSAGIYCSSKGSLDQLTRCMATEYGPHNIRVNSVNPTAIRTKMGAIYFEEDNEEGQLLKARTPLKRLGEVEEVVYPILFLLSDKASLISGTTLVIDGGATATMF